MPSTSTSCTREPALGLIEKVGLDPLGATTAPAGATCPSGPDDAVIVWVALRTMKVADSVWLATRFESV